MQINIESGQNTSLEIELGSPSQDSIPVVIVERPAGNATEETGDGGQRASSWGRPIKGVANIFIGGERPCRNEVSSVTYPGHVEHNSFFGVVGIAARAKGSNQQDSQNDCKFHCLCSPRLNT